MSTNKKFWRVGARWSDDGSENPISDIFKKHNFVFVGSFQYRLKEIEQGDIVAIFDGTNIVYVGYAKGQWKKITESGIEFSKEEKSLFDYEDWVIGIEVDLLECKIEGYPGRSCQLIQDEKYKQKILEVLEKQMKERIDILKQKKQIILTGAPGTGKTYLSAELAMRLINGKDYETRKDLMGDYQNAVEEKRIVFTTFHQSVDYEEFVEGYKPITENDNLTYQVQDGIFKQICKRAKDDSEKPYILIIDEINRGNISKILGELITLLEADKRLGEDNEIKVKLPYSNEEFSVPNNLYIISTMNTADRSIGYIDYAIRRRFAFITLKADEDKIQDQKGKDLFAKVKAIFDKEGNIAPDLNADDLMVGHSYFMAENEEELKLKLDYEIKPLLLEYVKDGVLVGDGLEQQIQSLSV